MIQIFESCSRKVAEERPSAGELVVMIDDQLRMV